jgi:hypothetical protein
MHNKPLRRLLTLVMLITLASGDAIQMPIKMMPYKQSADADQTRGGRRGQVALDGLPARAFTIDMVFGTPAQTVINLVCVDGGDP